MTTTTLNLRTVKLKYGSHKSIAEGACAMEMVAFLAGEKHSDTPQCTCPVIASFVRRLNDRMPDDATRTKHLRPLLKQLIGTRSTTEIEIKRGFIAADFAVREALPMDLEARGKKAEAAKLRALGPIVDKASAQRARDASASAAADAYAYAAYAYAAAAYAAAADAAAAAAAYAAAAAAYAARSPFWPAAIGCVKRMIEAGK